MGLAEELDSLLGDFSHLAPRIRHLDFNTDACGERIHVGCSYIAFRDGEPTFDEFISALADHIISFCLPRREIREAKEFVAKGDLVAAGRIMATLAEKARTLFIKARKGSHRSGEGGEVLLYLLTEWLLKAPQIVSKMYLKTNTQMPVFGTDGVHARYEATSKRLLLYWGESKAHATLASALGGALDSISEFITGGHAKREIDIVSDFSDFDGIDAASIEAFLRYLDPYAEESNERVVVHSCLLVFEHEAAKTPNLDDAEQVFKNSLTVAATEFISSIKKTVEGKGLGPQRFHFFLVPVPSAQEFRDKFQAKIGWPP